MRTEGIFDHTALGTTDEESDELDDVSEAPGFDLFAGERIHVPQQIAEPEEASKLPLVQPVAAPVWRPVATPGSLVKADTVKPAPHEPEAAVSTSGLTSNQQLAIAAAAGFVAALLLFRSR